MAMNRWRCGRSATRRASTAAAGRRRGSGRAPATATPSRLAGDALDRVEVARRDGGEAGLDDVDVEADELAGDLQLLGRGQAGAGRLLAVAEGRVEDADRPGVGRGRDAGKPSCRARYRGHVTLDGAP